jgi:phosphatidate cytidylyltransferase
MAEKVTTRIKVGLSLSAVVLSLLGLDAWLGRGACFGLLVAVALAAGAAEMVKLSAGAGAPAHGRLLVPAVFVLILERVAGEELGLAWLREVEAATVVLFALLLFVPPLFGVPSRENFLSLATTTLAFFYIWFLGHYAIKLRYLDPPRLGSSPAFFLIFIAKTPDVFAYFVGKGFGKTKLIPNVSPGKTVAGFVGAILGAVVTTLIFTGLTSVGQVLPIQWSLPFAIIFGLVSISGDLVESYFKRSAATKDSASLFPTFGGVLDVIDSIVLTAPVLYYSLRVADLIRQGQA